MRELWRNHWQVKLSAWIESLVITLLALYLCHSFSAVDPFTMQTPFPWLWFAPVLIALRYGIAPSLLSIFTILVSFFVYHGHQQSLNYTERLYLLGGIILTVICAEFRVAWSTRVKRAEQLSAYAEHRLNTLSRAYYLTRISHEHLEQSLIAKPASLRGVMTEIQHALRDHHGEITTDTAASILELLSYYCGLKSAGIFLCSNNQWQTKAIAVTDSSFTLNMLDPLFKRAAESNTTCYHSVNSLTRDAASEYEVVAPIISSEQHCYGILCVKDIRFFDLAVENLEILTMLLQYFADHVWANKYAKQAIAEFPQCDEIFAAEFIKLQHLSQNIGTNSTIVHFILKPNIKRDAILELFKSQQRGLDFCWEIEEDGLLHWFNILPLSGIRAAIGYIARITEQMYTVLHLPRNFSAVSVEYQLISRDQSIVQQLTTMMQEHGQNISLDRAGAGERAVSRFEPDPATGN